MRWVLRDIKIVSRAIQAVQTGWEAHQRSGKPLELILQPETIKRSQAQNKYYWQLLQQIASDAWVEGRQYSAETWHEYAKRRFIGTADIPGGGSMAISSTSMTKAEFAHYVQKIEVFAAQELGVTLVDNAVPFGR